MPRVQINLRDIDEIEELEEQEDWEEQIGLRSGDERRAALLASQELAARRRNARGSAEKLAARRSDRRKSVHRGGRR
ncbi:MAG: hypothetical protein DIU80_007580 [Chloroflexota bacterium]|nr:MAG: hypothetical protein DIU80_21555 [Chloroflexota bacterium]